MFGAEGPFIGIHLLNTPPAIYGLLGLIPFVGTLVGSLLAIRLTHINPMTVLRIAFLFELLGAIIMFVLFVSHIVTLFTLLAPMALLCVGHPILSGTAMTLALRQTSDKANASAVMNFAAMSMPVFITFLLGMLHTSQAWVMPVIFLISLLLMVCVYFLLLKT